MPVPRLTLGMPWELRVGAAVCLYDAGLKLLVETALEGAAFD